MNRLTKLIKMFYANILRDFLEGEIRQGTSYFYFLETSHTTLMMLDRKAIWNESEFTTSTYAMETAIEFQLPQNGLEFSHIILQKGIPDARIFIKPHLSFSQKGFFLTGTLDNDYILIYEKNNMALDKFMVRRIEKRI
jgi:hypothetical protein